MVQRLSEDRRVFRFEVRRDGRDPQGAAVIDLIQAPYQEKTVGGHLAVHPFTRQAHLVHWTSLTADVDMFLNGDGTRVRGLTLVYGQRFSPQLDPTERRARIATENDRRSHPRSPAGRASVGGRSTAGEKPSGPRWRPR